MHLLMFWRKGHFNLSVQWRGSSRLRARPCDDRRLRGARANCLKVRQNVQPCGALFVGLSCLGCPRPRPKVAFTFHSSFSSPTLSATIPLLPHYVLYQSTWPVCSRHLRQTDGSGLSRCWSGLPSLGVSPANGSLATKVPYLRGKGCCDADDREDHSTVLSSREH